MSFSFPSFFKATETDVIAVLTKVKLGVVASEVEVQAALKWIAGNAPTIATDIEQVVSIVTALGAVSNPEVATAVAAANTAVVALNAYSAASAKGAGSVGAVVQGYVALQQANSAVAAAKAASAATVK